MTSNKCYIRDNVCQIKDSNTSWIDVALVYQAGTFYETPSTLGQTHLLEHLLFNYLESTRQLDWLEDVGVNLTAFTYKDCMIVGAQMLPTSAQYLSQIIRLIKDFKLPTRRRIRLEMDVVNKEYSSYEKNLTSVYEDLLVQSVVRKEYRSLVKATPSDTLKLKLHKSSNLFTPKNSARVVVRTPEYLNLNSIYYSYKPSNIPLTDFLDIAPSSLLSTSTKLGDTSMVGVVLPIKRHTSQMLVALELYSQYLSRSKSSGLFEKLRFERGLAYNITSGVRFVGTECYFVIYTTCSTHLQQKVVSLIKSELRDLSVFIEKLSTMKSQVELNWKTSWSSQQTFLSELSRGLLYDRLDYYMERYDLLEKLTTTQAQDLITSASQQELEVILTSEKHV